MNKILTLPNCITSFRIAGAIGLLFFTPMSGAFYTIYTLCGISDMLDGWVARATNSSSEFGAKLDSIADLLFYAGMLFKILPILWQMLPRGIWFGVALVIVIRLASYIIAAIRYRRFASLHTYLNKVTGAVMFAVPYFLPLSFGVAYCFIVCVVAGISSAEELLMHISSNEYQPGKKTILKMHSGK